MLAKIYRVKLSDQEREELKTLVSKGRVAARKQTHARILLLCDETCQDSGAKKDDEIVATLSTSRRTVER